MKTAKTDVYIGKGESSPLSRGPRNSADPVKTETKTVAAAMRDGMSHKEDFESVST